MSVYSDITEARAVETLQVYPIDDIVQRFAEDFGRQHPILEGAERHDALVFQQFMSSASTDLGEFYPIMASIDKITDCSLVLVAKRIMRDFLFGFATSPIAALPIVVRGGTLETNILRFVLNWSGNTVLELDPGSLERWTLLLELLVTRSTAISIWRALIAILLHPAIFSFLLVPDPEAVPTPQISPARQATPISSNSNCMFEGAETHQIMDQRLRHELDGLLFPNTPGFLNAYFPLSSTVVDQVLALSKPTHLCDAGWVNWPTPATENLVRGWFNSCINPLLQDFTTRRYTGSPTKPLKQSSDKRKQTNRKPDIFLCDGSGSSNWSDVLVVGELKQYSSDSLSPQRVVELANYVRLLFQTQPYRRFVHAFTLGTDMMRCWIFHRSGALGSDQFSINANPQRFLSVIVGYATMTPAELGYDPTITTGGDTGRQVTVLSRLYDLRSSPFVVTAAIASRGTTCSEAKLPGESEFKYVCKDAWRSHSYISEGILLLEAQTAGVEGLVEYIGHTDMHVAGALDDISGNIMKGLDMTGVKALNLRPAEGRSTAPPPALEPQSLGPLRRGSSSAHEPRKRPYPGSLPLVGSSQKRQMTSRSLSVTPASVNRVHTRLITTKGRPITQFRSNRELLLALRDAIQGHRSLFRHGILHRDISVNNIMITLGHRSDGFHGFLIDLDLARRMDDTTDTITHHRTGTMEFMAIGALCAEPHTYRHDLESFFYVFVWICIHYLPDGTGKVVTPTPTILNSWGKFSFPDAAAKKRGDMDPGGFEILVAHFTEKAAELVPLAWAIREVLFPVRDRLFTGTDPKAEPVYERLLKAIGEGVEEIEG